MNVLTDFIGRAYNIYGVNQICHILERQEHLKLILIDDITNKHSDLYI